MAERKGSAVERRREKRMPVRLGCWLVEKDGASCCQTFDLSDTGVSILASDPPAPGQSVILQFFTPLSAGAVTVEAEVVWSRLEPEGAMGLRFMSLDEATRNIIREFARMVQQR